MCAHMCECVDEFMYVCSHNVCVPVFLLHFLFLCVCWGGGGVYFVSMSVKFLFFYSKLMDELIVAGTMMPSSACPTILSLTSWLVVLSATLVSTKTQKSAHSLFTFKRPPLICTVCACTTSSLCRLCFLCWEDWGTFHIFNYIVNSLWLTFTVHLCFVTTW